MIKVENLSQIEFTDFLKIGMYVGTILSVSLNEKAIKPAYVLEIDFGAYGIKKSSAQITENYSPENLLGKQIIAVLNFPPKKIAGVKSECLVLAAVSSTAGTVLLNLAKSVENGTRIL
ncbi:MAG: tRNA-binding protein [Candidatus Paceibacterota bacterium]